MIQRMLSNLLDNAIKYTPSGGSVTVSLEEKGEHLLISVTDTGVGISQAIFPAFLNGSIAATRAGPRWASGWA